MAGAGDGDFFEQFIEDYYAESDEHLATARRALLGLEESAGGTAEDAPRLRELFRSLHTLKGLSGMVGLASAERVAHALEDSVRAVERADDPFEPALVDALLAGVDLIERCIAARRTGGEPPDVDAGLAALARVGVAAPPGDETGAHSPPVTDTAKPASPTPSAASDDEPDIEGAIYGFEFVPSQELMKRGVNVESVRARLRAIGTLLSAQPRMVAGGVAFDFSVAVSPGREPDEQWRRDGLSWTSALPTRSPEPAAPRPESRATAPAATPAADSAAASASVVRVDLARLDEVMRMVGDLVVSRSRLEDAIRQGGKEGAAVVWDSLEETSAIMERQMRRLREGVMRIRLVPIGEVFERLRFAVRDAARESGRRVTLSLHGQHTEIDKVVVDRMLEPLLHLVRNAVSHGIEPPDERVALGKPAEGRLTLRAMASGDRIRVDVEDDGAGIDLARVAARARSTLGREEPVTAETLLDVLCAPGFSTRDVADTTSGRGVGMEVVRSAVRGLGGELTVDTEPGRGTRFTIDLPLTLMIVDALLVAVGNQQMAVPQPVLREILQVDASAIVSFENNDVISYRGGVLPLLGLARLFGFDAPSRASYHLLVVGTDTAPMGLLVDRLLGLREIVVLPVVDPLVAIPGISGATEIGDGQVSLVLDTAALLRRARHLTS